MHRFAYLVLLAGLAGLAGCPPPGRYARIEVRGPQPLPRALVAAECGLERAAQRTDDRGHAQLRMSHAVNASQCTMTVAYPGYSTVQARGVTLCTSPTACPALVIETYPSGGDR